MTAILKPYGARGNTQILAKKGIIIGPPPPPPAPPTPGGKGGGPGIAVDLMAKKGGRKGGIIDVRRAVIRKSSLLAPQSVALMAKRGEGKGGIRLVESKSLIAMAGKSPICANIDLGTLREFAPRQVVRASARD